MSTAELKLSIIQHIANISDQLILEELSEVLKLQPNESLYQLSEEEQSAIQEARKQIQEGKTFTHEKVQEEVQQWLKQ